MDGLNKSCSVIPANAGIQKINRLDPGLRRGDDLFRYSLRLDFILPCFSVGSVAII